MSFYHHLPVLHNSPFNLPNLANNIQMFHPFSPCLTQGASLPGILGEEMNSSLCTRLAQKVKESTQQKRLQIALQSLFTYGAPDRIRTCGLLIRSPLIDFSPININVRNRLFNWVYLIFQFHCQPQKTTNICPNCCQTAVKKNANYSRGIHS